MDYFVLKLQYILNLIVIQRKSHDSNKQKGRKIIFFARIKFL